VCELEYNFGMPRKVQPHASLLRHHYDTIDIALCVATCTWRSVQSFAPASPSVHPITVLQSEASYFAVHLCPSTLAQPRHVLLPA